MISKARQLYEKDRECAEELNEAHTSFTHKLEMQTIKMNGVITKAQDEAQMNGAQALHWQRLYEAERAERQKLTEAMNVIKENARTTVSIVNTISGQDTTVGGDIAGRDKIVSE